MLDTLSSRRNRPGIHSRVTFVLPFPCLRILALGRSADGSGPSVSQSGIFLPNLLAGALIGAFVLAGCASSQYRAAAPSAEPAVLPTLPPAFQPEEIVGRWGFAAYHKEGDRARTVAAAKAQCNNPYVINRGQTGGVIMHLADDAKASELRLKGAPDGKTYVGPEGPPASQQDREVVTFDGRVLVLRWVDPEVAGRYGTGVYERCGARVKGIAERPVAGSGRP
jgi:hypothetical protein